MPININKLKSQVARAISNLPTEIVLKRYVKNSDGYGGYTSSLVTIATFDAFVDFGSSSIEDLGTTGGKLSAGEAGTIKQVKGINLIAVIEDSYTIKIGDMFELDRITYSVSHPKNMNGVYWDILAESSDLDNDVKLGTGVATGTADGINPTGVV